MCLLFFTTSVLRIFIGRSETSGANAHVCVVFGNSRRATAIAWDIGVDVELDAANIPCCSNGPRTKVYASVLVLLINMVIGCYFKQPFDL